MGESLVGAYMRYVEEADFVVYGTRTDQQGEIDIIAFKQNPPEVILCEVATHLDGLLYGTGYPATAAKVRQKMERAIEFAEQMFSEHQRRFEWWSPRIQPGLIAQLEPVITDLADQGTEVEIITNEIYAARVAALAARAKQDTKATGEPFFRALQILTHLKPPPVL